MLSNVYLNSVLERLKSLGVDDAPVVISGRIILAERLVGSSGLEEGAGAGLMVPGGLVYGTDLVPNEISITSPASGKCRIGGSPGGLVMAFDCPGHDWWLETGIVEELIVAKPPYFGIRADSYKKDSEVRIYPHKIVRSS